MATIVALLRRFRADSGAELVEFALVFPLLLLVVLGIVDFGFLFQEYEVVTNAAREGARIAILPEYQNPATVTANVTTRVNQYLDAAGLDRALATVSVSPPTLVSIGTSCVTTYAITVTYPHAFSFVTGIVGYFGGTFGSSTLTATSTMRAEGIAGTCS